MYMVVVKAGVTEGDARDRVGKGDNLLWRPLKGQEEEKEEKEKRKIRSLRRRRRKRKRGSFSQIVKGPQFKDRRRHKSQEGLCQKRPSFLCLHILFIFDSVHMVFINGDLLLFLLARMWDSTTVSLYALICISNMQIHPMW